MFELTLTQKIVIRNRRLKLLYNVLMVIVGSATLCTFIVAKYFSKIELLDVRPKVCINDPTSLLGFNTSRGTDSVCGQDVEVPPGIKAMSGQRLVIGSHNCVDHCNFGNRSQLKRYLDPTDAYHCVSLADTFRHESPDLVRVVTSTLAWDLDEALSSTAISPSFNASMSVYPWLTKMLVTFEFAFELHSHLNWFFGATTRGVRGDQSHAHVVFVDVHGRPTKVFHQPSDVTLELSDILRMATVPASSENFDKTMLYWGAWLESTITCTNDMGDFNIGLEQVKSLGIQASTEFPVCAIQIKKIGRVVSYEAHTDNSSVRVVNNVSIKVTTSHNFMRLPSLWATIINLASFVVVLKLPTLVVRVLCSRMLGHLSLVYRQSLERSVDIAQYCAGWAMRVALIAANLYPLTPNTDEHLGYGAVPVEKLHRMLRLALGHHAALDEDDVRNILSYAFNEIGPSSRPQTYRNTSKKRGSLWDHFISSHVPLQPLPSSAQLKIGHITELCITNDIVSFDAVAGLLDGRRPLGLLEKMFMPGKLLKSRFSVRSGNVSTPQGSLISASMLGNIHTVSSANNVESSNSTSLEACSWSDGSLGITRGPVTGRTLLSDTSHGSDLLVGTEPQPDMSAPGKATHIDGHSLHRFTEMAESLEEKHEDLRQLVCQLREELKACKKQLLHAEHKLDSMHAKQLQIQGSRQTESQLINMNSNALNFKVDVLDGNLSAWKRSLDLEIDSVRNQLNDTCARMQAQLGCLSKQGEMPSMHGGHSSSTDAVVTHQITAAAEEHPVQRWVKDALTQRSTVQNHHDDRSVLGSCTSHGGGRMDPVNLSRAPRSVLHNVGERVVTI